MAALACGPKPYEAQVILRVDRAGVFLYADLERSREVCTLTRSTACRRLESGVDAQGRAKVRVEALDGAAFPTGWGRAEYFSQCAATTDRPFDWEPDPEPRAVDEGDAAAPRVPAAALDEACLLAAIGPEDVVVDVACGDGRVASWAVARFGARAAWGLESDAARYVDARDNVAARGLGDRVTILRADAAAADADRDDVRAALAAATVLVVAIEPGAADAWEPLLWDHLKRRDGAKVRALCLGARPPDAYVAAKCKRLKQPYEALDVDAFLLTRDSRPRRRAVNAAPAGAGRVRMVSS